MRPSSPAVGRLLVLLALGAACGGSESVGPPSAIESLSTGTLTGTVGQPLAAPIRLRVVDAQGRGVPGVAVAFSVTQGGGQVDLGGPPASAVTDTTDGTGEAGATWTLGTTAGAQVVTAAAAGLNAITFSATAQAGPPVLVAEDLTSGIVGLVGVAAPDPLAVRIADQFGNPVQGATVGWTSLTGGASVAAASTTTDANGVARVGVTLGASVDFYLFQAALAGGSLADTLGVIGVVGVADPQGDAGSTGDDANYDAPDIVAIGAAIIDSVFVFFTQFGDPIQPPSASGSAPRSAVVQWVDIDLDQDTLTGAFPLRTCIGDTAFNFGSDGIIEMDPTSPNLAVLYPNPPAGAVPAYRVDSLVTSDRCGNLWVTAEPQARVPVYAPHTVAFGVPLALFADEGTMAITTLSAAQGTFVVTDYAPDTTAWVFNGPLQPSPGSGLVRMSGARYLPSPIAEVGSAGLVQGRVSAPWLRVNRR